MKRPNSLIFSLPRSGSTLLVSLLNSDKRIRILNDTFIYRTFIKRLNESDINVFKRHVVKFISRKYPLIIRIITKLKNSNNKVKKYNNPSFEIIPAPDQNISISRRKKFIKELIWFYDNTFKLLNTEWLVDYKKKLKKYDFKKMRENENVKDFLDSIFSLIFDDSRNSFEVIGEKTPFNLNISEWMDKLYPDSKQIVLIRNPITNIGSMVNHGDDFQLSLQKYLNSCRVNIKKLALKKDNLFIRYEDIIYNTEKTIESVYNYLGMKKISNSLEMDSNIRSDYVGNYIDPSRDREKFKLLSDKEKIEILSSCKEIINTYYPDWNKIYPHQKI